MFPALYVWFKACISVLCIDEYSLFTLHLKIDKDNKGPPWASDGEITLSIKLEWTDEAYSMLYTKDGYIASNKSLTQWRGSDYLSWMT